MTTDDIKKIAEAYLDKTYPKYREFSPYSVKNKIAEIVEVIKYFSDHYFIVEKSKIEEEYKKTLERRRFRTPISKIRAAARRRLLILLFGCDVLHHNEK